MTSARLVRTVRACRAVLLLAAVVLAVWPFARARADSPTLVFAGHAEAYGARATMVIPKAPLSDTLVDLSAPATAADLSSVGGSSGFSSFPSPGPLVLSVPGLVSGLVNQGAAGLPPLDLPSIPNYPLYVQADGTNPDVNIGTGPYQLSAVAHDQEAHGDALTGLQVEAAGNALLVTAMSSVVKADGEVTAKASVIIDGVSVGPLTLGEIRSTATVTYSGSGSPEMTTSFEIDGARLAGIPITISADGISVAGTSVPLPIGSTLTGIMQTAGIDLAFPTASQKDGVATSPGLVITRQVDTPGVGTGTGTFTMTLGSTSASIKPPVPVTDAAPSPTTASSASAPLPATKAPATGLSGGPVGSAPSVKAPAAATVAPAAQAPAAASLDEAQLTGLSERLDLGSLYLAVCLAAIATVGLGTTVRLMGVRTL